MASAFPTSILECYADGVFDLDLYEQYCVFAEDEDGNPVDVEGVNDSIADCLALDAALNTDSTV